MRKVASFAAVIWEAKSGGNLNRGVVTVIVWSPQGTVMEEERALAGWVGAKALDFPCKT